MCNAYLAVKVRDVAPELSQEKALAIVRGVMRGIQVSLESRGEVRLSGVGTIRVFVRPARTRRNPKTGAAVNLQPSKVARFRTSETLVELLNVPPPPIAVRPRGRK